MLFQKDCCEDEMCGCCCLLMSAKNIYISANQRLANLLINMIARLLQTLSERNATI
jgi:hypothetical protein